VVPVCNLGSRIRTASTAVLAHRFDADREAVGVDVVAAGAQPAELREDKAAD